MSRAVYIIDELMAALGGATSERHVDHLLHLGLPPAAVDMCGTAKIRPDGQNYVPDDDGIEAVILPCFDASEPIDLLAFVTADPGQYWLRLGQAAYIGGDALGDAVMGEPVRVFRTPLSWLRAGAPANGLVVLDDEIARRELAYHSVVAEDLAHGEELLVALTIPAQHPTIGIPRQEAA